MYGAFGILFSLVCCVIGAALLSDGISNLGASQTMNIVGGAALLTLGFMTMWIVAKNWWEWRKEYRRYRSEELPFRMRPSHVSG